MQAAMAWTLSALRCAANCFAACLCNILWTACGRMMSPVLPCCLLFPKGDAPHAHSASTAWLWVGLRGDCLHCITSWRLACGFAGRFLFQSSSPSHRQRWRGCFTIPFIPLPPVQFPPSHPNIQFAIPYARFVKGMFSAHVLPLISFFPSVMLHATRDLYTKGHAISQWAPHCNAKVSIA